MGLQARALLWSGLFLALVLAPLAVAALLDPTPSPRPFAVELSAAFGLVAFALFACEFALVARLKAASAPFGTDALMLVHRQLGIAATLFLALHAAIPAVRGAGLAALGPFAGPAGSRAGAAAGWLALALVGAALVRRRLRLPYEIWRVAHAALALALVALGWYHAVRSSGYASAGPVRWLLEGYVLALLALFVGYRVVRPLGLSRRPWELVENRDAGGDVRILAVRPVGHAGLRFEPGQFAWVTTGRTPLGVRDHPISIASSSEADGGRLELAIKALGDWSRDEVPALLPGARLWIDGPYGAFTPDRYPAQELVLIAGGIGVSPLRSMLLSMRDRGDRRPALLLLAARHRGRMAFAEDLARLSAEIELRCVAVLEEPGEAPEGWIVERGRVTEEILRRHLPAGLERAQFFVCGPAPMMASVEAALARLGVPRERVQSERYDMV